MDLLKALKISASGMNAQSARMRVAAENMANSETMPEKPGGEPYRRKTGKRRGEMRRRQQR